MSVAAALAPAPADRRAAVSLHPVFRYSGGLLMVDAVSADDLVAAYGAPIYVYADAALRANAQRFRAALDPLQVEICYAVKANGALGVIAALVDEGLGADIVSAGELARALAAGARPEAIVFSGVGKTEAEMRAAMRAGVRRFNIESAEEAEALAAVGRAVGITAAAAIRVNPDVAAGGHEKISTGKAGDKFGVSMATAEALWPRMAGMDGLTPRGLAVHIGSQIADPAKFSAAFERLAALADRLSDPTPAEIDLGGGFGVDYGAGGAIDLAAYVGVVRRWFGHGRYRLTVEPGRALTADAGALLTRVIRWKQDDGRAFMIVDAAMSDFLRPALYGAEHEVIAAGDGAGIRTGDLVGPVCETADLFRRGAALPDTPAGGVIALCGVGAYGAAMANAYNARALPAEVMVRGAEHVLLRPPFDHSRMMALEQTPEWSQPSG